MALRVGSRWERAFSGDLEATYRLLDDAQRFGGEEAQLVVAADLIASGQHLAPWLVASLLVACVELEGGTPDETTRGFGRQAANLVRLLAPGAPWPAADLGATPTRQAVAELYVRALRLAFQREEEPDRALWLEWLARQHGDGWFGKWDAGERCCYAWFPASLTFVRPCGQFQLGARLPPLPKVETP